MKNKQALILNTPFLEPYRPPISTAIVGGITKKMGYKTTAIDLNIKIFHDAGIKIYNRFRDLSSGIIKPSQQDWDLMTSWFSRYLTSEELSKYDIICISIFSRFEQKPGELLIKHIRNNCGATIIIGGNGVKSSGFNWNKFGKYLYEQDLVDYYVEGEGEQALIGILNGDSIVPGVNGIENEQIDNLDDLPRADYSLYNINDYQYLKPGEHEIFIEGSRGCVRHCTFCDVHAFWLKYRYRDGKSIAEEVIKHYEHHGISNFYFTDSLFNGSIKSYRIFLETLAKYPNKPLWSWSGFAIIRNKKVHPIEDYQLSAEVGNAQWVVGVEHGVDRIRIEQKKHMTNEDIEWHLENSTKYNITNTFLFMPTWATETLEEHKQFLKIFKKWKKYVASGAIYGINIAEMVGVQNYAPMATQFEYAISENAIKNLGIEAQDKFWINKDNPTLDQREKIRRSLAIYREALKHKWPLVNSISRISTLQSLANTILSIDNIDNPNTYIDFVYDHGQ